MTKWKDKSLFEQLTPKRRRQYKKKCMENNLLTKKIRLGAFNLREAIKARKAQKQSIYYLRNRR